MVAEGLVEARQEGLGDALGLGLHGVVQLETEIAAVAETYSVAIAPHNPNGPVATAACLAIDAVTPNFMIQEMFTPWDVDWRDTVVIGSSRVVDGYIEVPDRPGLGVELGHDELAKHPFEAKDLQIFSREA